jgi:hypothetical protein
MPTLAVVQFVPLLLERNMPDSVPTSKVSVTDLIIMARIELPRIPSLIGTKAPPKADRYSPDPDVPAKRVPVTGWMATERTALEGIPVGAAVQFAPSFEERKTPPPPVPTRIRPAG